MTQIASQTAVAPDALLPEIGGVPTTHAAADIAHLRCKPHAVDRAAKAVDIAGHSLFKRRFTRKRNDRNLIFFRPDNRFQKSRCRCLFFRQSSLLRHTCVDQDRKAQRQIDLSRERGDLLKLSVLENLNVRRV